SAQASTTRRTGCWARFGTPDSALPGSRRPQPPGGRRLQAVRAAVSYPSLHDRSGRRYTSDGGMERHMVIRTALRRLALPSHTAAHRPERPGIVAAWLAPRCVICGEPKPRLTDVCDDCWERTKP